MGCFHPIKAYWSNKGPDPKSGSWPVVFNSKDRYKGAIVERLKEFQVPCGQCIGCRLDRSRAWAVRCVHESKMHNDNCFITLTYNNENIESLNINDIDDNKEYSLNKKHFVDFMKRLRRKFGAGIRFFHCGEYGEKFGRPHHHACIFGLDFKDKKIFSDRGGLRKISLYTSETLEELWGFGYCIIGEVNFESAAYCARYICKKITGELAESHYNGREPEYVTMSRRPGLGIEWYKEYGEDIHLRGDKVVLDNGRFCKAPRYYDNVLKIIRPEFYEKVKNARIARLNVLDNTFERLIVKEEIKKYVYNELSRSYESKNI